MRRFALLMLGVVLLAMVLPLHTQAAVVGADNLFPFASLKGVLFSDEMSVSAQGVYYPGWPDPTFGNSGTVFEDGSWPSAVAIQPDGRIVVISDNYGALNVLVRYLPDGSRDMSFGTGGAVTGLPAGRWNELAIQPDGKIVVVYGSSDLEVARFNADGTVDTSFGAGSGAVTTDVYGYFEYVEDVLVQSDGKIVVLVISGEGGAYEETDFDFIAIRYLPDGSLDTSFGNGGIATTNYGRERARAGVLQPDGKLVMTGHNGDHFAAVRLNSDGSPDASFGTAGQATLPINFSAEAFAIVLQPDGKMVLGGTSRDASYNSDWALARLNADGTLDTNFGTNGIVITDLGFRTDFLFAMGSLSSGHILASGVTGSQSSGEWEGLAVVRYTAEGVPDPDFTHNSDGRDGTAFYTITGFIMMDMAIQPDDKVVLASTANGAALLMRILNQTVDTNPTPAPLEVNSADDVDNGMCNATHCSLREAINASNLNPTLETITFNIPGAGPHTIQPTSALPEITDPVIIDGTTQPGYAGTPLIEIDGTNAEPNAAGLTITAGNSTVRGLAINRFANTSGIWIETGGGNIIQSNYLGTDTTGTAALGNAEGIVLHNSADNVIGGDDGSTKNLISGNTVAGIGISGTGSTGNRILTNFIGTDITGTLAVGNQAGISIVTGASYTHIGGIEQGELLISGNSYAGIALGPGWSGMGVPTSVTGTIIQSALIGTSISGNAALPNLNGIVIQGGVTDTLIGGPEPFHRNVISGNAEWGVAIESDNNVIQGNLIGTDITGNLALGNFLGGIRILGGSNNLIGGPDAADRNLISDNGHYGVLVLTRIITSPTTSIVQAAGNRIEGNFLGTDILGLAGVGWQPWQIVFVNVSNNEIVNNVIAGDMEYGIVIHAGGSWAASTGSQAEREVAWTLDAENNIIQGNRIGTDVNGANSLWPGDTLSVGIALHNGSHNLIGGTQPGEGNLISGMVWGVYIWGNGQVPSYESPLTPYRSADGNVIRGNWIGTDASGSMPLPNEEYGIYIADSAFDNVIGSSEPGASNIIAYNGTGILLDREQTRPELDAPRGNIISGNAIFGNQTDSYPLDIGIDLGGVNTVSGSSATSAPDGVTPNDPGDADTGPNNLQNYPVLTSAQTSGTTTDIEVTLHSAPNTLYRLEFFANTACDASGYGEGEEFLEFTELMTDGSGNLTYNEALLGDFTGQFITATATDPDGNTSEFSACVAVEAPTPTPTATPTVTPLPPNVLPVGLWQETDSRITYSGAWQNWVSSGPNGGSTRYTNQLGAMASFSFEGTGFILYRLMSDTRGLMEVCIDGACQTVNNYSAVLLWNQPVTFGGLAAGVHSATIRNAEAKYLDVDAIQVFDEVIPTPTPTYTPTATHTPTASYTPTYTPTASHTPLPGSVPLPVGLWQETDSRITFTGTWQNWVSSGPNGGSTRYTNQLDAMASFSFEGTGFTLYRLMSDTRGLMEVCIDGACQTVNNYSAVLLWNQPVTFGGLAAGVHSATIRNAESKYLDVDAIQVFSDIAAPTNTPTHTPMATHTQTHTSTPGGNALPVGLWQETDSRIAFTGTWQNWVSSGPNGGSTRYTNQLDASASFSFEGTGFTLYRLISDTRGLMEVCIDGACQTVNNYSASLLWNQPVTFGGLAAGVHSAAIRNAESKYLDVDAIQVFSDIAAPTNTPTHTPMATHTSTPGGNVLPVGLWQETDSRIAFTGTWQNWVSSGPNGGSTRYTNQLDAMASFSFEGTGFTLYRLMSDTRGLMEVCIDGACQTVNNYSASLLWNQPVTFGGLAAGVHSAAIRNAESKYLDVDAIQVMNN